MSILVPIFPRNGGMFLIWINKSVRKRGDSIHMFHLILFYFSLASVFESWFQVGRWQQRVFVGKQQPLGSNGTCQKVSQYCRGYAMYFSNFLFMFWYETIHHSAVVSYGRTGAGSCGEGSRDRAEVCEWCGVPDLATRQGGTWNYGCHCCHAVSTVWQM